MAEDQQTMAARLRQIMEDRQLTNFTLAYESGVSEKTISRILNGGDPRYGTIKVLAGTLRVDPTDLVGRSEQETRQLGRIEQKLDRVLVALNAATSQEAQTVKEILGRLEAAAESTIQKAPEPPESSKANRKRKLS